jgi:C4-dicarboxylate-specific signal transduction histidine kinase
MVKRDGKSVILFAGLVMVAILSCGAFAFVYSLLDNYRELDRRHIEDDARRAFRTFSERFSILETKVADWGAWDEAFEFIHGRNPDFAAANLLVNVISGLKIQLIAYLKPDLTAAAIMELKNGELVNRSADQFDFLQADHPLLRGSEEGLAMGIVNFGGKPGLAAAKTVSNGDGSGPPAGRVIFVKAIDDAMLQSLTEQTLLKFSLLEPRLSESAQEIDGNLEVIATKGGKIYLESERAFAHFNLADLRKVPLAELQVEIPREVLSFGVSSTKKTSFILALMLVALIVASAAIYRLFGIRDGILELLSANQKFAERESYLTALIDSVPGYVSWFDRSMRYLGVNRRLADDFGRKPEDFVGQSIGFMDTRSIPVMRQHLEEFFESSDHFRQDVMFVEQRGERRRFLLCLEKYQNGSAVVAVGIDTTPQWRAEQQALHDRQVAVNTSRLSALGEMAGGIAHEINNPLAIIQGTSRKLARVIGDGSDPKISHDLLQTIDSTTQRIAKIVNGLRTFARDGSSDPFSIIDLGTIISDVSALSSDKFLRHGVELRLPQRHLETQISCRQVQMGQVLVNLLNNSFDAVQDLPEKWVEIAIEVKEQVEISVTDSGSGIPPELVAKIMDPFFTTKPVGKGTGLGLSISAGIIQSHGGKLSYDPTSKNTRFLVSIPRMNRPVDLGEV